MTRLGVDKLFRACITASLLLVTVPGMLWAQNLRIYTWPDYIDPEIVAEFEHLNDTTIEFSYFDSNEARDQELAITNGRGHDILLVNRLQLPKYMRRGWLQPLSTQNIPNLRHIDKHWFDTLEDASHYGAANFWGTMGIGYREDHWPEGFHSWNELLQPEETLRNRLSMPAATRELIAMAMKGKGLSVNTSEEIMIREAGRILLEQKPFVRFYGYPLLTDTSGLVNGKVWAGAFHNGDVVRLQAFNENIRFVIPEEGGILWVDYLTVAQSSDNKTLAFKFIDFLNEPDTAARHALAAHQATPNSAARALLPAEFLHHPLIYPSEQIIGRSEFLESMPPRSQKQINVIGTQLTF